MEDAKPVRLPASAYLEPEDSPFSARALFGREYELKLAKTLLTPLDSLLEDYSIYSRTATVVSIGGFIRPWALLVHEETPSKFFVFCGEANLSQAPVQVPQRQLPAELGNAICDAWERVLSQTRYPKEPDTSPCDGVLYHFGFRSAHRTMAGKTWSPPEETHPGKLAALAHALRDYGEGTVGVQDHSNNRRSCRVPADTTTAHRPQQDSYIRTPKGGARQSHPVSLVQQTSPFPESEAMSILRQRLALNHIGYVTNIFQNVHHGESAAKKCRTL